VDGRDKPGHDSGEVWFNMTGIRLNGEVRRRDIHDRAGACRLMAQMEGRAAARRSPGRGMP